MERTSIDIWVGAFVAVGFAALLILALKVGYIGGEGQRDAYKLEARFDNIGGLKVRAPVKSAGVVVGRVQELHFDNERFQASVTLALEKRFVFPKDTTASILTSGLLGEVYIGLDAGGDDKNLANGDRISITQSAVVLERLIGQFLFQKAQEEPARKEPAKQEPVKQEPARKEPAKQEPAKQEPAKQEPAKK